jgi:hypothetical protein
VVLRFDSLSSEGGYSATSAHTTDEEDGWFTGIWIVVQFPSRRPTNLDQSFRGRRVNGPFAGNNDAPIGVY